MIIEKNHLYHIYNQGNNRDKVFYSDQNYLLFINKISEYVAPYVDFLAWCLMPNHFHLMVYVNSTEISIQSERVNESKDIKRSLNNSIGILLRSYTDSINKELGRTGSLFRQKTKAVCLDPDNGIIPAWYTVTGSTMIPNRQLDDLYPQVCFNYIHYNPVVSGLVKNITSWKYSSVHEFLGVAGAKLINKQRAEEFGLRLNSSNQSIK